MARPVTTPPGPRANRTTTGGMKTARRCMRRAAPGTTASATARRISSAPFPDRTRWCGNSRQRVLLFDLLSVGIAPPIGAIEPAVGERVGDVAKLLARATFRAGARVAIAGAMARARQVDADASRTFDATELGPARGAGLANERGVEKVADGLHDRLLDAQAIDAAHRAGRATRIRRHEVARREALPRLGVGTGAGVAGRTVRGSELIRARRRRVRARLALRL